MRVNNNNASLTFTVQDGTWFEYPNPKNSSFANSAVIVSARGSSAITLNVQGTTFKNIVNDSVNSGGDSTSTGTSSVTFSSNTVTVDSALNQEEISEARAGGVDFDSYGSSALNVVATGNMFDRASGGGVFSIGANGTSTLRARVESNTASN
ncbi:MAG: hypothetical protein HY329_02460, partial [Chloroflexi bacterium]|nr:hypothetical protein [Chloroflexota bacterium]